MFPLTLIADFSDAKQYLFQMCICNHWVGQLNVYMPNLPNILETFLRNTSSLDSMSDCCCLRDDEESGVGRENNLMVNLYGLG